MSSVVSSGPEFRFELRINKSIKARDIIFAAAVVTVVTVVTVVAVVVFGCGAADRSSARTTVTVTVCTITSNTGVQFVLENAF